MASVGPLLSWLKGTFQWQHLMGQNGTAMSPDDISVDEESGSFLAKVTEQQKALHSLGVSKLMGISASKGDGVEMLIDNIEDDVRAVVGDADQESYMITRYDSILLADPSPKLALIQNASASLPDMLAPRQKCFFHVSVLRSSHAGCGTVSMCKSASRPC